LAAADPDRVRTVASQVHRADTFRGVLGALADVLPEAAAALEGGQEALDALVADEMAAKRQEKEAARG
ncbi:hypothetical protein GUG51_18395, partial [Xanthomonas citri pv. citri]|nr:hypothetical protein [Xanthomonas citri pv. citri]